MLNTLFPQLCELDGVRHVRLMDQFGSTLQTTKKWPESVEEQRSEWATCCSIAEQLDLGPLFEVWMEGRRLTLSTTSIAICSFISQEKTARKAFGSTNLNACDENGMHSKPR